MAKRSRKALAEAEKKAPQDVAAAVRASVREPGTTGVGGGMLFMFQLAQAADELPRWWSPQRDAWLRAFWPSAPFLPGVIYSICGRNAAFRFEFNGPDAQVQYAKDLTAQADLGVGWQPFIMKVSQDLYCLAGPTKVHLGAGRRGQTKTIAAMVKDKDPGPVLSVDDKGHIVERNVIEWHKTPLGGRRWWWLSLKNVSMHSGERKGGIFLTEDHPVLTDGGWLMARDVRPGMKVACGDPAPSEQQAEVLVGGLLGDMGVGMIRKRAMLRFSHSLKQENWLDFKLETLKGFQWTGRNYHRSNGEFGSGITVGINSRSSLSLTAWRKRWYPEGKKVIAREDVERYFSPRMLTVWYCDDGHLQKNYTRAGNETSPSGSLHTNCFLESDVDWLAALLTEKGIPCTSKRITTTEGKAYPYIYISCEGMRRLAEYIGPYVPPLMRYKLPDDAPSYDPVLWDIEPAAAFFDEVAECRQRDYSSGYRTVQTTWHLRVEETGNFVAANTAVHNTQDNGAFIEVIRPARVRTSKGLLPAVRTVDGRGNAVWRAEWRGQLLPIDREGYKIEDDPADPPLGIAHLDAMRCRRTGDVDWPVVYTDRKGREHKLGWWQVITLEDMPSPVEDMNGVGFCAVSRVLRAAQILRDVATFKREKLGGRNPSSIWLTNVKADRVSDAVTQAQAWAESHGYTRYMKPIFAEVIDPQADPKAIEIALRSLPDGYDEEITLRWFITEVALGTGTDYSYLAPLPGAGLGTATQVETMSRQTKGKASRLFMNTIEFKFRYCGILPKSVGMNFVEVDEEEQLAKDNATQRRAETRSIRIQSGEITPQVARQIAVDEGDLEPEYLDLMAEEEATPEVTEEPEEAPGGFEPGDVTEEPEEKGLRGTLAHWRKAVGDRLQLRRPGSGYEGDVNAYAEKLLAAFDAWAEKWAARIAKADDIDRDPLILEAAQEIDEAMQKIAEEGLEEAYLLGLEGEELTDAGHTQVRNYTDRNLGFLEYSLKPDLRDKLKSLGDEGLKDAGAVLGALGTFRGRVATYAGPYWVLIWKGTEERAKGRGAEEARLIPVTWHLDDRAEHCDDCPRYAGTYESWEEMIATTGGVPADSGVSECGCNCRCYVTLG